MSSKSAIVIGAGIVGLAAARALALQGYRVSVLEKSERAVGASIRNFGMVWPIGQPLGLLYERALRSRNIWVDICNDAGLWHSPKGSLQLAYEPDEWQVIQEFAADNERPRGVRLLNPGEVLGLSQNVNPAGLSGGFFSPSEVIVNPRQAIAALPGYLKEKYGVGFHFGKAVTAIDHPAAWCGKEKHEADLIFLCSGPEFETLYPWLYAATALSRCKLQMMRTVSQNGLRIGPAVCGGLTLLHYKSFAVCRSLPTLKARVDEQLPDYVKYGIHVMISQNGEDEIIIGDSHEYGLTHDPFIRKEINDLILGYLAKFFNIPHPVIEQNWVGIYPKMMDGATELVLHPHNGVTIVNGLGGNGMTLSFGLLEEVVGRL